MDPDESQRQRRARGAARALGAAAAPELRCHKRLRVLSTASTESDPRGGGLRAETTAEATDVRRPPPEWVLLTGQGRSGTTWIGSILNTHRDASYHFEPFLATKRTPMRAWLDALEAGDPAATCEALAAASAQPHPEVHYPPYPPKNHRRTPGWAVWAAFQMSKRWRGSAPLFARLAKQHIQPRSYVIKDVNLPPDLVSKLCSRTECRLLALVRKPFGSIASLLRGHRGKKFDEHAQHRAHAETLRHLSALNDAGPNTRASLPGPIESLSDAAIEALRWRIQTEGLLKVCAEHSDSYLINYDRFREDPAAGTRKLFEHLGWELDPTTLDVAENGLRTWWRRERFFSTKKSSVQDVDSWRQYLTSAEIAECQAVLEGSPALRLWPELDKRRETPD